MTYDSRPETLLHSQRVGELMVQVAKEVLDRSTCHDRSKTLPPEVETFDEFTPKLKGSTYGTDEYKSFLVAMGEGLAHHYAHNRHHPEHFRNGVDDMTLADLVEMLADWKAATERHDTGDLAKSLLIQQERFGLSDQLVRILRNTALRYRWLTGQPCGAETSHYRGEHWVCNVTVDSLGKHEGTHEDGSWGPGAEWPQNSTDAPTAPAAGPNKE